MEQVHEEVLTDGLVIDREAQLSQELNGLTVNWLDVRIAQRE